jgi:hypothetical protein
MAKRRKAGRLPQKAKAATVGTKPGTTPLEDLDPSTYDQYSKWEDVPEADLKRLAAALGWFFLGAAAHKSEVLKKLYDIERNPLFAWLAYRLNRTTRRAWALEYLDRVADKLLKLEKAAKHGEKIKAAAVVVALEMKKAGKSGRGNAFKDFTEIPEWAGIAIDVQALMQAGTKEYFAVETVAKESKGVLSKSKVWRAWREAKDAFPELVSKDRRHSET